MTEKDDYQIRDALNNAWEFLPITIRDGSLEEVAMVSVANSLFAIAKIMSGNVRRPDMDYKWCQADNTPKEDLLANQAWVAMEEANLKPMIDLIKFAILYFNNLSGVIDLAILASRYLIVEYDRDLIPDWIALLAEDSINEDHEELLKQVKIYEGR